MAKVLEWRDMTAPEVAASMALGRCSFSCGTFDKRFSRKVAQQAMLPKPKITIKQAALLVVIAQRYRRQIGYANA